MMSKLFETYFLQTTLSDNVQYIVELREICATKYDLY